MVEGYLHLHLQASAMQAAVNSPGLVGFKTFKEVLTYNVA